MRSGAKLRFLQSGATHDVEEVGIRTPALVEVDELGPGEVGYLIAGIKDVGEARVGETVTEVATSGDQATRGIPEPEADGVLRHLPDRRRRVPRPA